MQVPSEGCLVETWEDGGRCCVGWGRRGHPLLIFRRAEFEVPL